MSLGATFSSVDAIIYQRSSAPSTPVAVNWLLLQKAGLRENGQSADTSCYEKVSDDDEDDMSDMNSLSKKSDSTSVHKYASVAPKTVTTERKKSLGLLTQNFVKLFLCTDMDMISLDDAAKLLLGDGKHTSMTTRTKVRRLYDIANVLSSMKFIEKQVLPLFLTTSASESVARWSGARTVMVVVCRLQLLQQPVDEASTANSRLTRRLRQLGGGQWVLMREQLGPSRMVCVSESNPSPHGGRGALPSDGGSPSDLLFLAGGEGRGGRWAPPCSRLRPQLPNLPQKLLSYSSLLLGEDRMQRGLFRYDVTSCETKVIPGTIRFIVHLNEDRHLKKRPTEFCVDKVLQPFDENKFNFTKIGQEEQRNRGYINR
ncbi:E2F/DP winged-helix DNA-binding domain [Castilleja foliolosa]|uniref:E2F/DP winged-helix DNA-binding domain n=1 Tax=Castilleja foliolosa TaxID=1961234 RepID=A0ABD3E7V6_9LAMI